VFVVTSTVAEHTGAEVERENLTSLQQAALGFEAPYVVEKLVKNRTADSEDDAALLFREAKRYLVLAQSDRSVAWQMQSLRVDEAWHQFVLFTAQYAEFCRHHFGHFVHHAPSNSPSVMANSAVPRATFGEFAARYHELFGEDIPRVWVDADTVTDDRRLINEHVGALTVADAGDMVDVVTPHGDVVFRVSALARQAMRFVASTAAFHVRELPGDLTRDERVGLARGLVSARLLRVCG
jgi:hypothetical protein